MPKEAAKTSINTIPAFIKEFGYTLSNFNLDIGGGRFDRTTEYLKSFCTNLVYDPFNRSLEHNQNVLSIYEASTKDSITCLNVLNVILDQNEMDSLLNTIYNHNSKVIYFQVYEGDKSGIPSKSQLNQKASYYIPILNKTFHNYKISQIGKKKNIFKLSL